MERTNPFSAQLVFKAFKYTVYALLTLNIFLFYQEESLATAQTFSQGIHLFIEELRQPIEIIDLLLCGLLFFFYKGFCFKR